MKERKYPVYKTQGGGFAREVGGHFIFIEEPDCPGFCVGDDVPSEWDLQPANELAREKEHDDEIPEWDLSVPWYKDPVYALERMPDSLAHSRW